MSFKVRPTAHNVNINLIQIQIEATTGMKHVKTNIDILPPELALRIFGLLPKSSATCLGLTCPRLYSCLKKQHPEPICLMCHECFRSRCGQFIGSYCIMTTDPLCWEPQKWERPRNHKEVLATRIMEWMGPQYTLMIMRIRSREERYIFVHSNVYDCSTVEIAWDGFRGEYIRYLETRYNDWACAAFDNQVCIHDPGFRSRLPKPYNKGDSWYAEAMATIKDDIIRFDNVEDWSSFWHNFDVVGENKDTFDLWCEEFSLEQMHDGIKLLGL